MKRKGTCNCGGKIIKNAIGNIFCESCQEKQLGKSLELWAKSKEKMRERMGRQ